MRLWGLAAVLTGVAIGQAVGQASQAEVQEQQQGSRYTVPAGTHILMALKSPISTKNAQPGNPVYAQTTFPVAVDGHMLIPPGSYVQGVIDKVQRPGRIKGRAQLQVHFTTLILQDGYTVSLPGELSGAPGGEDEKMKGKEGTVEENGTKGRDVATVASGAGSGAVIGALSGGGKGAAIGSGAGAALGLAAVLLTRGPDVRFDVGTPVEMTLARPLVVEDQRLRAPTQYQPVETNRVLDKPEKKHNVPLVTPGGSRLPIPY